MMDASRSGAVARMLEAMEDVRRLAAQQDAERLLRPRPPMRNAAVQTDAIVTARVDVGTVAALPQAPRDASAPTDSKPEEQRKTDIRDLELGLLKGVLQHLDCITLFRARRVCRTWRAAVDDIAAECGRANAGRMTVGSVPNSDLHLRLLVTKNQMSALQAPSERGDTDLRIVAGSCRSLWQANLRGFRLSAESLRQLASNNACSMWEVILPAGVSEQQLMALLEPLLVLKHLSVSAPSAGGSQWLRALPRTLRCLDITGPGVTLPLQTVSDDNGLSLIIRAVTDQELHDLRTIVSRVTGLWMADCPGVTAAGVAPLFAGLTNVRWVDLRAGLDGAVTEAALDGLSGCSQLCQLVLGLRDRPVTDVPAAAVGRLAVACRQLWRLYLNTTPDSCRAVLSALLAVQQDLGRDSAGRPRNITLHVPRSVYSEMKRMASGSRIRVWNRD